VSGNNRPCEANSTKLVVEKVVGSRSVKLSRRQLLWLMTSSAKTTSDRATG
jgi:hypothetical protein